VVPIEKTNTISIAREIVYWNYSSHW
jgi:hypothetical protein